MKPELDRRTFLGTAAFTVVPRHVLGQGYVAPSDKITMAHIGCGTEGIRELTPLLASPDIQIVSVCDPSRDAVGYVDWSRNGIRDSVRRLIGKPNWTAGADNPIPGGREAARDIIDSYYAKVRSADKFRGVSAHADFRELLDKEKDIDAIKIMTPDHLHATVAIAAMKKGKHVITHKPIANRMTELRKVMDVARESKVATYFMPWASNGSMEQILAWVKDGAIGALREVQNWSHRPVWPQYALLPTDRPPIPRGFDWDLWLGPSLDRPYHPNYTHNVFRGWYEFGGGSMADMGHYSLWSVFKGLGWGPPISAEATPSTACQIIDGVSTKITNDYAFPFACTVRFKFAPVGGAAPVELTWYDGGMRPPTPPELEEDERSMPSEGFFFVGDKGRIMTGFNLDDPHIIPERRMKEVMGAGYTPPSTARRRSLGAADSTVPQWLTDWIAACRGGQPAPGNFLDAGPVSEAANLYAVALRAGGKKVVYDSANLQITNLPQANRFLTREYRKGWEL